MISRDCCAGMRVRVVGGDDLDDLMIWMRRSRLSDAATGQQAGNVLPFSAIRG